MVKKLTFKLQGVTVGPYVCRNLRKAYGDRFMCQGIPTDGYTAGIIDNILPKGTAEKSIQAGIDMFNKVHERCPDSLLVYEGMSQGAAEIRNVIEGVPVAVRDQITAGLLYGDTKFKQSGGAIKGLPAEKLKIYCVANDPVCNGVLGVTSGHLAYMKNGDLRAGFNWLTDKVDTALKARGKAPGNPVPDEDAKPGAAAPKQSSPLTPAKLVYW
jgi:cutinase